MFRTTCLNCFTQLCIELPSKCDFFECCKCYAVHKTLLDVKQPSPARRSTSYPFSAAMHSAIKAQSVEYVPNAGGYGERKRRKREKDGLVGQCCLHSCMCMHTCIFTHICARLLTPLFGKALCVRFTRINLLVLCMLIYTHTLTCLVYAYVNAYTNLSCVSTHVRIHPWNAHTPASTCTQQLHAVYFYITTYTK
jgi:hypothetical protein